MQLTNRNPVDVGSALLSFVQIGEELVSSRCITSETARFQLLDDAKSLIFRIPVRVRISGKECWKDQILTARRSLVCIYRDYLQDHLARDWDGRRAVDVVLLFLPVEHARL